MGTYSININTPTATTNYDLNDNMESVLLLLKDNSDQFIQPKYIRDSVYSSWNSNPFKVIDLSTLKYIGVGSGNPSDSDIKSKIIFGKRQYKSTDVMTNYLNTSDVDIFFYNTKNDIVNNNKTKIRILSGTDQDKHKKAPFIQTQQLGTQSLSFDIINENGDINLNSVYDSISINNLKFTQSNPVDGQTIILDNNMYTWDELSTSLNTVGATGTETNIMGSPILINGFPIDFTDNRPIIKSIGDINVGETFDNTPLVDVLRRMIYDYIPPTCSLNINSPYNNGYIEVGSSPFVELTYQITKNTQPTSSIIFHNCISSPINNLTSNGQQIISGIVQGLVNTPAYGQTEFKLNVLDTIGGSASSIRTLDAIYPYFYGIYNSLVVNQTTLQSLTQLVEPSGDKNLIMMGSGYIYIMYDSDYPNISDILDNSGYSIINDFSSSIETISSPNGIWQSKDYKVYRSNSVNIGNPGENFEIIF